MNAFSWSLIFFFVGFGYSVPAAVVAWLVPSASSELGVTFAYGLVLVVIGAVFLASHIWREVEQSYAAEGLDPSM